MRNRTMTALVVAEVVSSTGSAMTFIALPWFVLSTGGSPTRMSVVLAAEILPLALLGLPAGVFVSRLGARTSMLVGDLARAPLIALVPVLHWVAHLGFATLLVLVFLVGTFTSPYFASQRSIIPELFGDDETAVAKASGLFGGATQLPLVVGPALGGALIGFFGTAPLLVVDGATFLFAFLVVLTLVRGGKPVPDDESSRGILAGVRYLARDPLLGPIVLTIIILDGAANCLGVAVPLLAFTRYHRSAHVAGLLFTGFGVGMVIGSVVVVKLLDRFRPLRLASAAIVLIAVPIWFVALPIAWPLVWLAVFAAGSVVPLVNAPMMGLITTRPPPAVRAKVLTAVLTASGLGGPLGRLLIGPLYKWQGNGGVWVAIAGGLTLGGLLFVAAVARSAEDIPATAISAPSRGG
ncbi:MAG: MFS transporter [Gaiellaceae bacterium]